MVLSEPADYVGRFAPSPTGPLHFGSLLAALASYLEARQHAGQWLLRVEDIDPPREQDGAADEIVRALEVYGFEWDGLVSLQSQSALLHQQALETLVCLDLAYACTCSRKDLANERRNELGTVYPGHCRARKHPQTNDTAIRVRTRAGPIQFEDALQGMQSQDLEAESGDFIIRRRDGLMAYQLAVVVDDAAQKVTHVVRGIDLMNSTPRQIWLQQLLNLPTPAYAHIPVAVGADGCKLSKLTGAAALPLTNPERTLFAALHALRQAPPAELQTASLQTLWDWAMEHWDLYKLQGMQSLRADGIASIPT